MGATLIFLFISNNLSNVFKNYISVFLRDFGEFSRLPPPGALTDYSCGGSLLRYSHALIDTHSGGVDGGRVLGYDNAHGHHHRHCDGKVETLEFESYESIEKRFEAEVREYLKSRKG